MDSQEQQRSYLSRHDVFLTATEPTGSDHSVVVDKDDAVTIRYPRTVLLDSLVRLVGQFVGWLFCFNELMSNSELLPNIFIFIILFSLSSNPMTTDYYSYFMDSGKTYADPKSQC